jgi:hypothetical protein
VPGLNGTAPTPTSGAFPGRASDATMLWLASVPLLQGVFRLTGGKPTRTRAERAAAILRPMTLGTATPGCVVLAGDEVEVVGGTVGVVVVVVVVVVLEVELFAAAFFCALVGLLPHDARRQAVTRAVLPSAATRPPKDMSPLWFVVSSGAALGMVRRVT